MLKKVLLAIFVILLFTTPQSTQAFDLSKANIGVVRTNLPITERVNVCVSDVDRHHSEIVTQFVHKYFEGRVIQFPFSDDYDIHQFYNCDVINFSIGVIPLFLGLSTQERQIAIQQFRQEEYEKIHNLLQSYDGIIVESAGNEDANTTLSSPIARFKEINTDEQLNDRLFVVGQIELDENGNYIHHFSYGDEIDFVVPNYGEMVNGERYNGTSFASPVVSGVLNTLLQSGIPLEDLRNVIGYEDELHIWNGNEYRVFSVFKTYQNAYTYLESHVVKPTQVNK